MVLCYVDDELAISEAPMKTMEGIKAVFKLKGDKAEVPDIYICALIQTSKPVISPSQLGFFFFGKT